MRSRKTRSLWPIEHGAYAQLGLPLVVALALGRPTGSAMLLVLAAAALFMAREPIWVLLGMRGKRARREHWSRALRYALSWGLLAMVCGLAGLRLSSRQVLLAAAPPLLGVALLVPIVLKRADKTLLGELVAGATLSGAGLPVAVASHVPLTTALTVWAAWAVAFALTTAAVRWVIGRFKREPGAWMNLIVAAAATAALVALSLLSPLGLAMAPMTVAAWLFIARPPHPRRLKRVGWTLAGCSLLAAALLVLLQWQGSQTDRAQTQARGCALCCATALARAPKPWLNPAHAQDLSLRRQQARRG